jgi:hypothetical protein
VRRCERNARKLGIAIISPLAEKLWKKTPASGRGRRNRLQLSSIAATKTAEEIEQLGASESAGCQPARRFSTCPTRRGRRGNSSQADLRVAFISQLLTRAARFGAPYNSFYPTPEGETRCLQNVSAF